jgi:GntR family transcriptional repressor for pyruvate dehydrogenase complex
MPPIAVLPLKRTPRASLVESVARQLMDAIRDLEPGTRVPSERELTQMLGVSRTTLREALHGLVVLGAIEVRHGQGVFVATLLQDAPQDDLATALAKGATQDLLEARRLLLIEVARLAAHRRTDEDLARLDSALKAQRRAISARRPPTHEGIRFDAALADAAHNKVVSSVLRSFSRLILPHATHVYETSQDFWLPDLEMHELICEAVRAGDGGVAAERMREHVGGVADFYERAGDA